MGPGGPGGPYRAVALAGGTAEVLLVSAHRRGVHRGRLRNGHAGLEIGSRQGEVRIIGLWAPTTCRSSTSPHRAATVPVGPAAPAGRVGPVTPAADRKSTRLNSSHVSISYAVFCLKKQNATARA